ncbi:MAG: HAMP domain-containing sensor histidine kinase [Sphingobium sp.]
MARSLQPPADTVKIGIDADRPDPGSPGKRQTLSHHFDRSSIRDRDLFVAGLAHELRTPLSVLKGRLHALEDGVIDPASGECGRLLEQVEKLLRVTDSLTTLAQAHDGQVFLDWRSVDISRIVVHCFQETAGEAPDSPIRIMGCDEATIVTCDPARMAQALNALARFALLRLPSGSALSVTLSSSSDRFKLNMHCSDWALTPKEAHKASSVSDASSGEIGSLSNESIDFALAEALIALHGGRMRLDGSPKFSAKTVVIEIPWASDTANAI